MADDVWGLDSAGVGHGCVRGEMEELRGEVAQLRARGIDRGRRSSAGGTSTASSARFRSLCSEEGEGRNGTGQEASRRAREEKSGAQARLPTRGSGAPTATVAGMAGEQHRVEHMRSTVSSFE